ncbi:MAG TPA: ATP-dependent RNA helicase DbpA [Gammaproteobacteria bacterium]|nr:ATP-dependent RNA helicase DbpA [Gammaproteobacteria bacterium]
MKNKLKFSTLNLNPDVLKNLSQLGYNFMTPVQEASLPAILAGKDVIAKAKTGSGKTVAFSLGLLECIDAHRSCVQSLVLCPTRELADQVAKEIRLLARVIANIKVLVLCGGHPMMPQVASLKHAPHIVVGTPGRVEKLIKKNVLDCGSLRVFVLDEADRMLDMGFEESINEIISRIPVDRQTLLFSATYPNMLEFMTHQVMRDPVRVEVDATHDVHTIKQYFHRIDKKEDRINALRLVLLGHQPESALVFCSTKDQTKELANELRYAGFSAQAINGDLEQKQRTLILSKFANKSISVLVATDVAARGLDVEDIQLVVNYYIASDPEVHVHRVGRTGRAGSQGLVCSLYSDHEEYKIKRLEEYLGESVIKKILPNPAVLKRKPVKPSWVTLQIDAGKKQKLRAGDILGALTGEGGIKGDQVGKIDIFNLFSFVAIHRSVARQALDKIQKGLLKGKKFRVRLR